MSKELSPIPIDPQMPKSKQAQAYVANLEVGEQFTPMQFQEETSVMYYSASLAKLRCVKRIDKGEGNVLYQKTADPRLEGPGICKNCPSTSKCLIKKRIPKNILDQNSADTSPAFSPTDSDPSLSTNMPIVPLPNEDCTTIHQLQSAISGLSIGQLFRPVNHSTFRERGTIAYCRYTQNQPSGMKCLKSAGKQTGLLIKVHDPRNDPSACHDCYWIQPNKSGCIIHEDYLRKKRER
jgi:hypothetical protein